MRPTRSVILGALGAALAAGLALAAGPGATVSGAVVSTERAGLAGARLVLTHRETGRTESTGTGDEGVYRLDGLDAGDYTILVDLAGFVTAAVDVHLEAGESLELELVLVPTAFEERVTVTGEAPRDTLEAAEVRRSAARDVGEALASLTGTWSLRKGGIANDVVVRGFQGRDLNLLIDGERIYGACPNRMDPPAFHVDFAEVDRIEVEKGPFDVQNTGGLGGAVRVVTRAPEPGLHATPFLAAGSWGYVNPSATVAYGGDGVAVTGGISHRSSDAYVDGSGKRFTETAGYETEAVADEAFQVDTAWAKAALELAPGHSVQLAYTRQEADQVYYPYLQMDALYDDTDRARLTYDLARGRGSFRALRAQATFAQVGHFMTDELRLTSAGTSRGYSMGTLAEASTAGLSVEATIERLKVGVEAYRREWNTTTEMAGSAYLPQRSLADARNDLVGLYLEAEQPLSGRWSMTAGARVDRAESQVDEVPAATSLYDAYHGTRSTSASDTLSSAFARFAYKAKAWDVSAGAGRSMRIPEPSERYFALRRMGSDWVGNPELSPSRNLGVDISGGFSRKGLRLLGSVFANQVDDNITLVERSRVNAVPGVANSMARSYANTDAMLYGAEASAVATLRRSLFLSGDVAFVRGTQDPRPEEGILSEDLAEVPPYRLRAALRYDTGLWWIEGEGIYSGEQTHVDTDLREQATPSWATASLKGGVERGPFSATVGATNLLDRTYHEHLSYQRDPFRSGTVVNEPGLGLFLNVGYRF